MPADRRVPGPLDTDTAPEEVANGRSAALLNVQLERGYATTVRGNVGIGPAVPLPDGANVVVGACEDPDTEGLVWLVWNSGGQHSLVGWQPGQPSPLLLLTWGGLRLRAQRGTTHAAVLDGQLIYLDAAGELRGVNLARAAGGDFSAAWLAANPFALHLLRQPVFEKLGPYRAQDSSVLGNLVAYRSFQFALRLLYADGSRSVVSGYSDVIYPRVSPQDGVTDPANYIYVPLQAGSDLSVSGEVSKLEVLVREGDAGAWSVAARLERDAAGAFPGGYAFLGSTTGEVLTASESSKVFESLWPAAAVDIAHSRVFVGDTTEGYPPAKASSLNVRVVVENAYTITSLTAPARTFHELCTYRVGVQYYDAFRRPGGVVSSIAVPIPQQTGPGFTAKAIGWGLSGLPTDEIPAWAAYYSLCVSQNARCQYFIQRAGGLAMGYYGDNDNGTAKVFLLESGHEAEEKAVWIGLYSSGGEEKTGGYVFEQGDVLRFLDEPGQEWPILYARASNWQTRDGSVKSLAPTLFAAIGRRSTSIPYRNNALFTTGRFEIYSPSKVGRTTDSFFEATALLPIQTTTLAGAPPRQYSVSSGQLAGDSFIVRSSYVTGPAVAGGPLAAAIAADRIRLVESASPLAPLTPARGAWLDTGRGVPAFALPSNLGQRRRKALVRFSGVKIAGTQLNGLGEWDALSQKDLPLEAGAVVALRLAAQGQTEGQTLIAVQERGAETLYLGQVPLSVAARQEQAELVALTNAVIGGTNTLRGGYGTRHPGSVVNFSGRLYWWDEARAEVCRYAADGVNPLNTLHECRTLGRELATTYAGAEVVAAYDARTEEYLLLFGAAPGGAPARTIRFSERQKGFVGDVSCTPEALVGTRNTLYSLAGGALRRHTDEAPRLSWDGQPAAVARVSCWANAARGLSKTWLALVQEGGAPLWELTEATTPEGQATRTPAARMARQEGQWVGPLLLDANSAGFTGTDAARRALYEGDPLQSTVLRTTLECNNVTPAARLVALSLEFTITSGQTPAP